MQLKFSSELKEKVNDQNKFHQGTCPSPIHNTRENLVKAMQKSFPKQTRIEQLRGQELKSY